MYKWENNRRFNAYSDYFKKLFGGRIQKLSVDAGFSCPNRTPDTREGGCSFCNNDAFNPSYCNPEKSVTQQLHEGIEFHSRRYKNNCGYLVYFQAYSNTYAPLSKLKKLYNEALGMDNIKGLVIGTRPDCVDEEKLDYFSELSEKSYLIIEYGIESCYDKTLERVNRGHTFEDTVKAINETNKRGIKTGGHIIFGLPGESREEMLQEASVLSSLPLNNIKFHQMQIIKNTQIAKEYLSNPLSFKLFEFEEYIEFIVEFVEKLNPGFVIERIAGEAPPSTLAVNYRWNKRNDEILRFFEKKLEEKNTWQGKYFHK